MKKQVKFRAELPTLITGQVRRRRVLKPEWLLLPEAQRGSYHNYAGTVIGYCEALPIPPYTNPGIAAVIKKLRRIPYTITTEMRTRRWLVACPATFKEETIEWTIISTF